MTKNEKGMLALSIAVAVLFVGGLLVMNTSSNRVARVDQQRPAPTLAQTVGVPPQFADTEGTLVSHTDKGVTITLETDQPGPKSILSKVDATTNQTYFMILVFGQASSPSTQATLSGLLPNTDYHLYSDGQSNHVVKTTDASGAFSFIQATDATYSLTVQNQASTVIVSEVTNTATLMCA